MFNQSRIFIFRSILSLFHYLWLSFYLFSFISFL